MTGARFLEPGTPTGVGSLPYDDVADAARHELHLHRELPAAPQLPNRSRNEGMLAQLAVGMDGVRLADDGWTLAVDRRGPGTGDLDAPLHEDAFAGVLGFLAEAAAIGHTGPVKVQLAGPITLGLALIRAGAKPSKAFAVAAATVGGRLRTLVSTVRAALPTSPVVTVVDEPGLTAYLHAGYPLGAEDTIDLLSGAMATATSTAPDVLAGVHCCGPTDWRLVLHAGPDLVSLPVDATAGDDGAGFSTFLDRGGFIAWGAVPTDRPLGDRDDSHWRRLNGLWGELARNGCDPVRLRTQALLTPSCGLALHRPEQVAPVYHLVRRVAERVQDQAIAARMSAGA
jgi:hypothetical protein